MSTNAFRLLYDGHCPFCRREAEWLARRDRKGRMQLVDITDPQFEPSQFGVTREEVHAVLHGILPDGRMVRRIEALQEAYRAAGLGWLAAPLSWPGVHWVADKFYGVFARHRVRLGRLFGRPADCGDACTIPPAAHASTTPKAQGAGPIQVGDRAPPFTLPAQDGRQVPLTDFRGKTVVLFFYPKDNTAICTKEACRFRDTYEDFVQAGAVVVGVSSDSSQSHQAFAADNRLPFVLLADTDGALRKAFGVPRTLGFLPGRVTYVIDRDGVVRHVFCSQLAADRHVAEALAVVQQLRLP